MQRQVLENYIDLSLKKMKEKDRHYYEQLTKPEMEGGYGLNAKIIANYALLFYKEQNKLSEEKYASFDDFLKRHFNQAPNPAQRDDSNTPIKNYIDYLIGKQMYAVSTVNCGAGNPLINKIAGIYRHGYIQIYDSPFKNNPRNNEILELSPFGQTNETAHGNKIHSKVTVAPGIVTMALHLAGTEMIATGHYRLKYYRPWSNDCHTLVKHMQEKMNEKLEFNGTPQLQQKIIDHFRYSPMMTKQDAENLRKRFGVLPHERIFKVAGKGLDITIPGQGLAENFRNVKKDRRLNSRPSTRWKEYVPWIIKQLVSSMFDRIYNALAFSRARKLKRALSKTLRKIEKMDILSREISNTILTDLVDFSEAISNLSKINEEKIYSAAIKLEESKIKLLNSISDLAIFMIESDKNIQSKHNLQEKANTIAENINEVKSVVSEVKSSIVTALLNSGIKDPRQHLINTILKNLSDAEGDLDKLHHHFIKEHIVQKTIKEQRPRA